MTTMSESAELIGWCCSRRLSAPATASRPKMMNRASSIVAVFWVFLTYACTFDCKTRSMNGCGPIDANARTFLTAISECQSRRQDIENGDGQKELPAEVHQLVIAEARKRTAHPDVEQEKTKNL